MQVQSLGWEDPLETEMTAPAHYSRPENPTDRGAWQAIVHGVTKESDVAWQLNKNGKHIGLQESFRIMLFSSYLPRSGVVGSSGSSVLVFKGASLLFSVVAASIYIPPTMHTPLFPHSPQHLLFVDLLMMAILTGVR